MGSFSSAGGVNSFNVSLTEVPEPGTLSFALAAIIPAMNRRRRS